MCVTSLRALDHAIYLHAAVARAIGIGGIRVEDPKDLRDGLREGLSNPGPVLIDLVTDPNALSMPPHIMLPQVKGFTIAAGKTVVMSGGVGKKLEMARANLRNAPLPG